jgi:catechol 2,3-dioxygenase
LENMLMNTQINGRTLPDETRLGNVSLTVADLERSLTFYTQALGFRLHRREGERAYLGAGREDLVALTELHGAHQPGRATGLYHFAILVPTRLALAQSLNNLTTVGAFITGFADHLVSEAIYLSDPDGNGIEIYRDRPRLEWQFEGGLLKMGTEPLDSDALLAELHTETSPWVGLAPETVLGHMHLQVASLAEAQEFYQHVLGFDLVMNIPHSAAFLSAGGYHHHIAINTWHSLGAHPPIHGTTGLRHYSVVLPGIQAMESLVSRVEQAGVNYEIQLGSLSVCDPSENRILFTVAGNGGVIKKAQGIAFLPQEMMKPISMSVDY